VKYRKEKLKNFRSEFQGLTSVSGTLLTGGRRASNTTTLSLSPARHDPDEEGEVTNEVRRDARKSRREKRKIGLKNQRLV
jgi:hypothetical protein